MLNSLVVGKIDPESDLPYLLGVFRILLDNIWSALGGTVNDDWKDGDRDEAISKPPC